jgi:hypothetical protein
MFYAKRQYQPLGEQCNPSYAFSLGAPGRTALPLPDQQFQLVNVN